MTLHDGLPVAGYRPQSDEAVKFVNKNKELEEHILRALDILKYQDAECVDHRWLAIGRSHIEQGFMATNRAIFQPTRVVLPSDDK